MIRGTRPASKAEITKQSKDIAQMAERAAAIADIAIHKCPVEKKTGDKDPKDWKQWMEDMRDAAQDLAKAAKAQDPAQVKQTAGKLNAACNACHSVFRD
jgi:cytochrome c556